MKKHHRFLDPRTLARLEGLALRAGRVVDGRVAGAHRSPHQGFSVEFAEHREYAPGDDLRHLDWKVFGRTDKFYLKRYEDETNLTCHIVVDGSESMMFGEQVAAIESRSMGRKSAGRSRSLSERSISKESFSKWEYACRCAASLAWLVLRHQDAVSLNIVDDTLRASVPASNSPGHLKSILHTLEKRGAEKRGVEKHAGEKGKAEKHEGSRKTDLKLVLGQLGERISQRGVVVVISDLFDDPERVLDGLASLRRRQHDVIAIQILDRREREFPFARPTRFRGLEQSGSETVDPVSLGREYRKIFDDYLTAIRRGCIQRQIDYMLCYTAEDVGARLAAFLGHRRKL